MHLNYIPVTLQQEVQGDAVPLPGRGCPRFLSSPAAAGGSKRGPEEFHILLVTLQQGVPGDAVPWPEREVSSQHPLLFPEPPQAARERYLNSYYF